MSNSADSAEALEVAIEDARLDWEVAVKSCCVAKQIVGAKHYAGCIRAYDAYSKLLATRPDVDEWEDIF